jgi:hypothetical protein
MRNKRLLWSVGTGVFLLAAGVALFLAVHVLRDRVTPENCARIEPGMNLEEVEAILGGPADLDFLGIPHVWVGERWAAYLDFDDGGRVVRVDCAETAAWVRALSDLPAPTFWRKLRRSLGW